MDKTTWHVLEELRRQSLRVPSNFKSVPIQNISGEHNKVPDNLHTTTLDVLEKIRKEKSKRLLKVCSNKAHVYQGRRGDREISTRLASSSHYNIDSITSNNYSTVQYCIALILYHCTVLVSKGDQMTVMNRRMPTTTALGTTHHFSQ